MFLTTTIKGAARAKHILGPLRCDLLSYLSCPYVIQVLHCQSFLFDHKPQDLLQLLNILEIQKEMYVRYNQTIIIKVTYHTRQLSQATLMQPNTVHLTFNFWHDRKWSNLRLMKTVPQHNRKHLVLLNPFLQVTKKVMLVHLTRSCLKRSCLKRLCLTSGNLIQYKAVN